MTQKLQKTTKMSIWTQADMKTQKYTMGYADCVTLSNLILDKLTIKCCLHVNFLLPCTSYRIYILSSKCYSFESFRVQVRLLDDSNLSTPPMKAPENLARAFRRVEADWSAWAPSSSSSCDCVCVCGFTLSAVKYLNSSWKAPHITDLITEGRDKNHRNTSGRREKSAALDIQGTTSNAINFQVK